MNKFLLSTTALCALAMAASASTPKQMMDEAFAKQVENVRAASASHQRQWHSGAIHAAQAKAVAQPQGALPKSETWGSLYTPEGVEWMYTADLVKEVTNYVPAEENGGYEIIEYSITGADFTIYNEHMTKIGEFSMTLPEPDPNEDPAHAETSINLIELSPILTKKFFNASDSYEVMVYVHATTADFNGHYYTLVYSINDPAKGTYFVTKIEGNQIGAINIPRDQFDETYTMIFMREEYGMADEDDMFASDYYLHFDVYHEASWYDSQFPDMEFSLYEPTLMHTFSVDYKYFSGAGDYAMPILIGEHNKEMVYALPRYEKEFFVSLEDGLADGTYQSWMDYFENPAVSPDNNFIIDLYNYKFEKIGTTTIPMASKEGFLWSFPGVGLLTGNGDMYYPAGSDKPNYIVGSENYVTSNDEFWTDFAVYDFDGNKVNDIIQDVADYIGLSDIPGQDREVCFYKATETTSDFVMVAVPSGEVKAVIPTAFEETSLTTSIDRASVNGKTYYVSSVAQADADEHDNAIHSIAWFNHSGALDHVDKINLGQNVAMAQPYISAEALKPYIFNTDSQMEYMFLVKVYREAGMSGSDEYLRVYSADSNLLLEASKDDDNAPLNSIFIFNSGSSYAKLIVSYYTGDKHNVTYYELPLAKFAGGTGSVSDPYQIASAGDLMAIRLAPGANFIVVNDIDFEYMEWSGNDCYFTGTIDGQAHSVANMVMSGDGIFNAISDGAVVKNLNIVNSYSTGSTFVTGMVTGSANKHTTIENVRVYNSDADADGSFGAIANRITNYVDVVGCAAINTDVLAEDVAGGIVASMGPGTTVQSCFASGSVNGKVAGGIVGESTNADTKISDCHSSANVSGAHVAGGIIGMSARSSVTNSLADGIVESRGTTVSEYNVTSTQSYAGGIVGWLGTFFENAHEKTNVIENCIVASPMVTAADADYSFAHRIVGATSEERMEPDPEGNFNPDGSYLLTFGYPEPYIGNNYVLGTLAPGNEDKNTGEANTLEGKSVEFDDELVALLAWSQGTSNAQPWVRQESCYNLYYETEIGGLVADQTKAIVYGDEPAIVSFFVLGNASAEGIVVTCDNESVAKVSDIEIHDNVATVTIEYVSTGNANLTATFGAHSATCVLTTAVSTGIESTEADKAEIKYVEGKIVATDSQITIYDVNGRNVASGFDTIDASQLARGIYIATTPAGNVLKFAVK